MLYFPSYCVFVFLVLFVYCASLYPGSSQHDIHAKGFSWRHNYWCDVLDKSTYAETPNPARPWGILATLVLCAGTGYLFYLIPRAFESTTSQLILITYLGIASMIVASLIFTPLHNYVIAICSILALIALILVFQVLYQNTQWLLLYTGLLACLVMIGNNVIYYSRWGVEHLPWIQKVSILIIFAWIVFLNVSCADKSA